MKQHQSGFTLIELLIVIAIIGILAVTLIPNLTAARKKTVHGAAVAYAYHCARAAEEARLDNNFTLVTARACEASPFSLNKPPGIKTALYSPTSDGTNFTIEITTSYNSIVSYDGQKVTTSNY